MLEDMPTGELRTGSVVTPTPPPSPPGPKPPVVWQLGQGTSWSYLLLFKLTINKKEEWQLRKARAWLDPPQPPAEPEILGKFTMIVQTAADGCERLQTVGQRVANTAQTPHPQSETGTLATHSGKLTRRN